MTSVLVIGIGNADCGDDAIGPLVADLVAGRVPAGVTVLRRSGDMLAIMDDWTGYDAVILVDAAAPVRAPGTVHRVDLLHETLPADVMPASTHMFGVAQAVELARTLGRLPGWFVVLAVEGARFLPGDGMTPAVADAAEAVAEMVLAEVVDMRGTAA